MLSLCYPLGLLSLKFGYKIFLKGVEMSKFFDSKIALPVAIMVMGSGSASAALNCTTQPTCEDLGYSKISENCEDYVSCPFDLNYKKCITGKVDCVELGFSTENKSGWCGNIITCPADDSYTLCAEAYEDPCPNGYDSRLTSVADCGSQGANGWTFSSQTITGNNGEDIVCGKCTAKTCSGYYASYQSVDDCGLSTVTDKSGWTFDTCYAGDTLMGKCTAKTCTSHGYMTSQQVDYLCKKSSYVYLGNTRSICYDCVRCSAAGISSTYLHIGGAGCAEICSKVNTSSQVLYGAFAVQFNKDGRSGQCYAWQQYNPAVVTATYGYCCCKNKNYTGSTAQSCYNGY